MVIHRCVAPPGRPATAAIAVPIRRHGRRHILGVGAVRADVLLHVVFPGECLVADGAVDALLPCVLLPVTGGMAGCRKCRRAAVAGSKRTRVLVLADTGFGSHRFLGTADRRLGRWRLGNRAAADALFGDSAVRTRVLAAKVVVRSNAGAAHVVVGAVRRAGRGGLHGFGHGVEWEPCQAR